MMVHPNRRPWASRAALLAALAIITPSARGQLPPVPATSPPTDPAALEARIAQLEALVRQSLSRQAELEAQLQQLGGPAQAPPASPATPAPSPTNGVSSSTTASQPRSISLEATGPGRVGVMGTVENELLRGAPAGLSATAPETSTSDMPPPSIAIPFGGTFGNGFEFKSADDEFVLQFHDLTQFDGRFYLEGTQEPTRDTFAIPRQWYIFNGRLTRPFEYYVAIAEGFDNLNLLDAYLNIHYDDRLKLRFGRYKTPFTYEFYSLPIQGLINPERSLFFNNFGINRDLGIMAWGELMDDRINYAAGIFNGTRNAYLDTNDEKDFMAFLNLKPWADREDSPFQNFQFGGSVDLGQQNNPANPRNLRTIVPTAGNDAVGTVWLQFDPDVREVGFRNFWTAHLAWYSGPLSLIAEYQAGYQRYATADLQSRRLKAPVQSYYVQAGYFLTGETVSDRGVVQPLRPFDLRRGRFGPGAIEAALRYNYINLDRDVFVAGLSDPNDWTNQVQLIDVGVNWYLNRFIKFYLGWERAEFGDPVLFAPDRRQITSDLFWFRTQIYF